MFWCALGIFAILWIKVILFAWKNINFDIGITLPEKINIIEQGLLFYLIYSFSNYWFHRWKHSNPILWKYLHLLHHSPTHMDTRVAFFRHPLEIFVNTLYLILIGKIIFNVPVEVIAIALTIEGLLETFHHSNIRISKKLDWLGYIIQLPKMHLIHHKKNLHRYNYSPFLWDSIFNTIKIEKYDNKPLGFSYSDKLLRILLFKK